jgi:hypothetical protein
MYDQSNISDGQRVEEIKFCIKEIERSISEKTGTLRSLLFEVFADRLYEADGHQDFKNWVIEFVPSQKYNTVNDWIVADGLWFAIKGWTDGVKWSDRAILALRGVADNLLEEVVLALPPNPTCDRVRQEADYVKPDNVLYLPSKDNSPSPAPTRRAGLRSKEAAETDGIIQGYREKAIALEQKINQLESEASSPVTTDLEALVQQLQQQIKDSEQARADMAAQLEAVLNNPPATTPQSPEPIEDFGADDKKIITKQVKRIQELEAIVGRLSQQLSDRASTSVGKELDAARCRIAYLERAMEEIHDDPSIVEAVKAYAPVGDIGVLQSELVAKEEAIARISANSEIWESKFKELRTENNRLAVENQALTQKVQSLNELLNVAPPVQSSRLPEVIGEAISECEKRNYSAMVNRASDGFAVATDNGSTTFVDAEDVADYLYANLEQFVLATAQTIYKK